MNKTGGGQFTEADVKTVQETFKSVQNLYKKHSSQYESPKSTGRILFVQETFKSLQSLYGKHSSQYKVCTGNIQVSTKSKVSTKSVQETFKSLQSLCRGSIPVTTKFVREIFQDMFWNAAQWCCSFQDFLLECC